MALRDLDEAYDRNDREALWHVLGGLKSSPCVRVGRNVSESFDVNVSIRQWWVMSPWLFNVYLDRVVR